MARYLAQRAAGAVLTLFGVSALVFVIMRSLPGNAAVVLAGGPSTIITPEQQAAIEERYGLNDPIFVQFGHWLSGVVRLDFGTSLRTGNPVTSDLIARLPFTLEIVVLALAIGLIVGVVLGVVSAALHRTFVDDAVRTVSMMGLAAPPFWVGLVLILVFASAFAWAPPIVWVPIWQEPMTGMSQIILPALSVGFYQVAIVTRMTRSSMLDVLSLDYIRAARARGAGNRTVLFKHALRNAFMPVITLTGVEFATLVGGLIVTETVWNVPGVSAYLVTSLTKRDYPAVQALVLLITVVVVVVNLLVDLSYLKLDPRTRAGQESSR